MKDKILSIIKSVWFPGIVILLALLIFALFAFLPSSTAETDTGTLTVAVSGLRNTTGNVIVCLFKAGPLEDLDNIAEVREMAVTGDRMTVVFAGIPFHEYAVFVLHDENKNKVPDTGPDNIPTEGMGMSEITMTPQEKPDFENSKFNFNRKSLDLHIPVIYWQ